MEKEKIYFYGFLGLMVISAGLVVRQIVKNNKKIKALEKTINE